MRTKTLVLISVVLLWCAGNVSAQESSVPDGSRSEQQTIGELNARLDFVLKQLAQTDAQVRALSTEVQQLRNQAQQVQVVSAAPAGPTSTIPGVQTATAPTVSPVTVPAVSGQQATDAAFREMILDPGLNEDERKNELKMKPELFVQARYSTFPGNGATVADFASNFRASRVEARWSGRISAKRAS